MLFIKRIFFIGFLSLLSQPLFAGEWVYTFRPGDTLWGLCEKYIAAPNCWKKIADRNKVDQPRNIKPGTRLYLPIAWLKVLPATAKVLSTRGDVQFLKAGENEAVPLTKATEIAVGDQIVTKEGTVTLQFADESILIVTPGSEVSFDTLSMYGESGMVDTRVRLNRGRAKAKVKPVKGPASRYEILTPAAVAAVRGTAFRVVSEDTDPPQMRTEVLKGNVAVGNDQGEQAIAAGYATMAVSGKAVEAPVKMLPAPAFMPELPEQISTFPWSLSWNEVNGAQAYRVQVFDQGLLFDELLKDQELNATDFVLNKLEEGRYQVVVRAIDKGGFEGLEASYTLSVVEPKEFVPLGITAQVDDSQANPVITWSWDAVDSVEKYKLHLTANTPGKGQQQKTIEVLENQFVQGVADIGQYQLKVAPVVGGQTLAYGQEKSVTIASDSEPPWWAEAIVGTILLLMIF